jgi:ssDNA-binding replication factor A large subunit
MTILTFHRCALLAPLVAVLAVASACAAYARETDTFMISAASGYGVEDCLAEGGECGHVVADAWCEAHGRGAALKFGRSDADLTDTPAALRPYFITCGE